MKKGQKKAHQWYLYTRDEATNQVILEIKKQAGEHDTDFALQQHVEGSIKPLDLWKVDFEQIQKIISGRANRNLKFTIYLEQFPGIIAEWKQPVRWDKSLKLILPLHSMEGDIEEGRKKIISISRKHSSANVSLVPAYLPLSEMIINEDDVEQLRRGFRTIEAMIVRGAFDEIWLFGNKVTRGMEKIILFCRFLNVPVKVKGQSKVLEQDFAKVFGNTPKK